MPTAPPTPPTNSPTPRRGLWGLDAPRRKARVRGPTFLTRPKKSWKQAGERPPRERTPGGTRNEVPPPLIPWLGTTQLDLEGADGGMRRGETTPENAPE